MSYEILYKKELCKNQFEIRLKAPFITKNAKAGQFIILRVDKNSNEAEVTISIKNPEATWTARGWINEDNSLELFDSNYSSCQANLTFSKNRVRIETSPEDDWDEILGEGSRLDGVYDKN